MKNRNTPMDIYSTHLIPFDVAAYCRGRRFLPESVALAKALREHMQAEAAVEAAQNKVAEYETLVQQLAQAVRDRSVINGD